MTPEGMLCTARNLLNWWMRHQKVAVSHQHCSQTTLSSSPSLLFHFCTSHHSTATKPPYIQVSNLSRSTCLQKTDSRITERIKESQGQRDRFQCLHCLPTSLLTPPLNLHHRPSTAYTFGTLSKDRQSAGAQKSSGGDYSRSDRKD